MPRQKFPIIHFCREVIFLIDCPQDTSVWQWNVILKWIGHTVRFYGHHLVFVHFRGERERIKGHPSIIIIQFTCTIFIYIRVCALRLSTCLIMMSQKRAKTSNTIACKCGVCLSTRRPFSDKTSSYKQWSCWYWHFMLKTNSFCSGFTKQPFKRICPFGSINWSNWEKIIRTTWGRAEDF